MKERKQPNLHTLIDSLAKKVCKKSGRHPMVVW